MTKVEHHQTTLETTDCHERDSIPSTIQTPAILLEQRRTEMHITRRDSNAQHETVWSSIES